MGLDIAAYSSFVELPPDHRCFWRDGADWEECGVDTHLSVYAYREFADHALEGLTVVDLDEHVLGWGTLTRCCSVDIADAEVVPFRAGSYGGYSVYRRLLCRTALDVEPDEIWEDPGPFRGRPFYEQINFADNEGTLGPVASAKLAKDYTTHAERVLARLPEAIARDDIHESWIDGFAERYETWGRAFRLAADTGLVDFH